VWFCSLEHLLITRILGEPAATTEGGADPAAPGTYKTLTASQVANMDEARRRRRQQAARRRMRTLCEDVDEWLGQAGEALDEERADDAQELLGMAHRAVDGIVTATGGGAPSGQPRSWVRVPEGSDPVHAALSVLAELDTQVGDAITGYCGAGFRARRLAEALLELVEDLEAGARAGALPEPGAVTRRRPR